MTASQNPAPSEEPISGDVFSTEPAVETPANDNGNSSSDKVSALINNQNLIIGGTINGSWVDDSEIVRYLGENQQYNLYSIDNGLLNSSYGSGLKEEIFVNGEKGYYIHLEKNNKVFNFGLTESGVPFPRKVYVEEQTAGYKELVSKILLKNGKKDDHININKIYKADLDNNGTIETLLSAEYFSDEDIDKLTRGEENISDSGYSFVLLLSDDGGKQKETLLAGDFTGWVSYEISFIADIDNDNTMEIMLEEAEFGSLDSEGFALINDVLYKYRHDLCIPIYSYEWHPFLADDYESVVEAAKFICPLGFDYIGQTDVWGNGGAIILNFGEQKDQIAYSALLVAQDNKYPYQCSDHGKKISPIKISGYTMSYLIWEDQYSLFKIENLDPDSFLSYDPIFPYYYFYEDEKEGLICTDLEITDLDRDGNDEIVISFASENNPEQPAKTITLKWDGTEYKKSS